MILPISVKQTDVCLNIQKNRYCVFRKNNRRDFLLNGVEEKQTNFNYVTKKGGQMMPKNLF